MRPGLCGQQQYLFSQCFALMLLSTIYAFCGAAISLAILIGRPSLLDRFHPGNPIGSSEWIAAVPFLHLIRSRAFLAASVAS